MVGQPLAFAITLLRRRGEGFEAAAPASPLCDEENPENEDAAEDSSAEPERWKTTEAAALDSWTRSPPPLSHSWLLKPEEELEVRRTWSLAMTLIIRVCNS